MASNLSEGVMDMKNTSDQTPFLLTFGFIMLPERYKVEKDVVMGLMAFMSFVSIAANGILLLVILKDPFKQLRTITAILLAFNSTSNITNSLVLFLDSVFYWGHGQLSPQLVLYFGTFNSFLYIIGNFLHTVNTYGAVVLPVRYVALSPKVRKVLVQSLLLIWVIILLVVFIPPYTLPKGKVPSYVEGMLTIVCVLLALLAITFAYLYIKIFQKLYARKQRLSLSFHLRRSTIRGREITKKNNDTVATLFIHVLYFMAITLPGSIIFLVFLQCETCDGLKLQLAALFTLPITYTSLIFLPLLWLFRLKQYKRAMVKILNFWRNNSFWRRRSKTLQIQGSLANTEKRSGSGSCIKELNVVSVAV